MGIVFTDNQLQQNFRSEWLEACGTGGYASSTLIGANTRRYHGMLVSPLSHRAASRYVLVSRLDDLIVVEGKRYPLFVREYEGHVDPQTPNKLTRFEQSGWPAFQYEIEHFDDVLRIEKSILALQNENTILISYTLKDWKKPVQISLEPFVQFRMFHALQNANESIIKAVDWKEGSLSISYSLDPTTCTVSAPGATYEAQGDWYYRFFYREERERGFDFLDDAYCPGVIEGELKPNEPFYLLLSSEDSLTKTVFSQEMLKEKFEQEAAQRKPLGPLERAAYQHVVTRKTNENERTTIIAGYPWFGDWGRDTMIALPGLLLETKKYAEAKAILLSHAATVSEGMIPNRFPDGEQEPEYNSVDASLWFFIAVYRYLLKTDDTKLLREVIDSLSKIEEGYRTGTRFGIRADTDGLIIAGSGDDQLTWMDARVDGKPITPRHGKPVEVNALWYNAQRILSFCYGRLERAHESNLHGERAESISRAFQEKFWSQELQYCFDVIGEGLLDASLRPNQLFTIGLPFSLLEDERALMVLKTVKEHLLTPVGLRTLSPKDPNYRGSYHGGSEERDSAYHQGTVWPWLIGIYADAVVRFGGDDLKKGLQEILDGFEVELSHHGIGSISEIFSGDAPHRPNGCISQAWSVAEVLRARKLLTTGR